MAGKAIVLSTKPQYADLILNGKKTVELRRVKPKYLDSGSLVLIYASSPVKAMVGAFSVNSVVEKPLDSLWEDVKSESGISYDEFKRYFEGINKGIGIFINECWKLATPITLDFFKKKCQSFTPPQSFRYATEADFSSLNFDKFCYSGGWRVKSNRK
jgi:predicted transcriptional regulator